MNTDTEAALLAKLAEVDPNNEGVERRDLEAALGWSTAQIKDVGEALLKKGALEQIKSRPNHLADSYEKTKSHSLHVPGHQHME